ncbi:unnamed protein product [Allacma fusca]|uniref:Ammonium transporter n=1 Tax=Allacma fusca TaxID=39272 RepID=A0A8J2J2P0_9HEXA|nr:unnamed protein product [Allacma fusca]
MSHHRPAFLRIGAENKINLCLRLRLETNVEVKMSKLLAAESRSDFSSGFNQTLLSALFLLNLVSKFNSSLKYQLPQYSKKGSHDELKYSKKNLENLQEFFDSLQNDEKQKGTKMAVINTSKVNFQSQNNSKAISSNNKNASGSNNSNNNQSDGNEDRADLGTATANPSAGKPGRRTSKRPKPTKTPRMTTRKKVTTLTPSITTQSSSGLKPVDAVWILLCGIIIFTMQTGFGLLEGGIVSQKNETNIMLKNVADVVLGGFTYWAFGYGITFGTWYGSVSFFGLGFYFVDESYPLMGDVFTSFFFQLSFATTATTIVSGALAERTNFKAYCLFSLVATFTYSVQARWVWGPGGFLAELGAVDIAGSGCVHLVGGASAFVAAWMVGPRLGRFDTNTGPPPMGNHNNALVGLFLLWWGWIAFNAGSTYGITANKWQFAARAASTTMIASIGGGLVGMFWGFVKPGTKVFDAVAVINAVLGALVGITAGCAVMHSVEAFSTGVIGACVVLLAAYIPDLLKVDDPVGATAVHGFGGIWGLLAVGVFAEDDFGILGVTKGRYGLVRAGGWYLLGVQTLTAVCIASWAIVSTFVILFLINFIVPLRVSAHEELTGLDFSEHGIRRKQIGTSPAISLFGSNLEVAEIQHGIIGFTGQNNPGMFDTLKV